MSHRHATIDGKNSTKLLGAFTESGFVIVGGAIPTSRLEEMRASCDEIMRSGHRSDFKAGSTTDRCFFSGQIAFGDVTQYPLLLAICGQSIGRTFKLKAILGRTVRPGSPAQALHADVAHDSADAPVVGFILMLDAFTPTNGATRFIPGSQGWSNPSNRLEDPHLYSRAEVLACGDAGSIIIFDASVWHGHTANTSQRARRSIQGYFSRF